MGQLWKDVNIVVDSAKRLSLPLLVATATAQYFDMAQRQGMSGQDSARLIKVLEKMSQPE
jgi:3-hydroxyisobutyrate dehydrogenase-like beta-hydroxyacid dehydrogenase